MNLVSKLQFISNKRALSFYSGLFCFGGTEADSHSPLWLCHELSSQAVQRETPLRSTFVFMLLTFLGSCFKAIHPFKRLVCQFTKSLACACHRRGAGGVPKASETSFGEWLHADLYQDKHTSKCQIIILLFWFP